MIKFRFVLFIILFISTSCDNNNNNLFEHKIKVVCKQHNAPFMIGIPLQIIPIDSLIIFNDFKTDPMLTVYDLEKDSVIYRYISIGNGPNENSPPLGLTLLEDSIFIHARSANILFSVSKSSFLSNSLKLTKLLKLPSSVSAMIPVRDSNFLVSGTFNEGRFAVVDKYGEIQQFLGEYPSFMSGENEIPLDARGMFHQSFFFHNTKNNKIAAITSHVLELYDYNNLKLDRLNQVLFSNYEYTYSTGNVLFARALNNTQNGACSFYTTDNYIYVLYNPNIAYSDQNIIPEIWIFDWDGNPIKCLQPDVHLITIGVDKNDKRIIAIDKSSELFTIDL